MASDGYLPMELKQGEDWTSQVIWTDDFDEPLPVVHPCRMDIKSTTGQMIHQLETNPDIPDGEIPSIALSTEMGLVQLHIPNAVTSSILPGEYYYDLFVTVDDGTSYPGPQIISLSYGPVSVFKRFTQM